MGSIPYQTMSGLFFRTSPATNKDTTTGTGTTGDVVMTGYLQSFLFFEDDAKEKVLLSLRFRYEVNYEAELLLLPYITALNITVGLHIRGDDRDECSACVIATNNFFERSIYFMRQNFHGNDDDSDDCNNNNVTFVVAKDSKLNLGGVLKNSPDIVSTEKEDPFVDMAILAGCNHIIIAIGTYRWWDDWMGLHQREVGVVIY